MYWANQMIAGWLSLVFFYHPEPDYWKLAFEHCLRSDVLPNIAGI